MCGIWAVFGFDCDLHQCCSSGFSKISHRGPDAWRIDYDDLIKNSCVGFQRLTILDSLYGMQPMKIHKYPRILLLCNGELYNFKKLIKQYDFPYETKCDVEIIIHLYATGGIKHAVKNLDGVFSFILIDFDKRKLFLGRDPFGVRPLFTLTTTNGQLGVCSEAKGLICLENELTPNSEWHLEPFKPSHFAEYDIKENGCVQLVRLEKYFEIASQISFDPFISFKSLTNDIYENIRTLFTEACQKRLMADRRIGCLLSGGLDSSLVAAIVVKIAKESNLPYKIQTFSIGMEESPDIKAAREVANFIGSEHYEVIFTEEEVANCLDKVIYSLESPDITTIRASIGMYLLSKYIKENTNTTVIFSGEGADELAQGYIYFRDAPSAQEGHDESLRLLRDIYLFDGLRADRTTSAHSLELRVPFLDLQFSSYYLSLPKEIRQPKNGVEKFLIRNAFDKENLLPHHILWRHKEAFSDGVASAKKSLFTITQEITSKFVNDADLENAKKLYPKNTPFTKESLYYRNKFEKHFPNQWHLVPYYWMPKWTDVKDPSARFISHYAANEQNGV